jgi:hypothetical protein
MDVIMVSSWHKVRYDFYKTLRRRCNQILGYHDKEILSYQRDYLQDVQRPWVESSVKELISTAEKAHILLMGDFHALYQSQKGHVRVLRMLPRQRSKVLFVEFVASQYQSILDAYMRGEIRDPQFLKGVHWVESWGFSWRSYKPILSWAKRQKIPVIAVDKNLLHHGDYSLRERDEHSSDLIAQYFRYFRSCDELSSPPLGIVIVGDYHISSEHLPRLIEKKLKTFLLPVERRDLSLNSTVNLNLNTNLSSTSRLRSDSRVNSSLEVQPSIMRVFQNSENIYFHLAQQGREYEVDVIRYSQWDFSLVSVAPWIKWHSLLMHLESQATEDYDLYHDAFDEVLKVYRLLKSDLGTSSLDENFNVMSLHEPYAFSKLEKALNLEELQVVYRYIKLGFNFYIPQMNTVLISKLSLNYAAEGAMSVWLYKIKGSLSWIYAIPEEFYSMVWFFLCHYLGSKLINPKRKTPTLYDIQLDLKYSSLEEKKVLESIVKIKTQENFSLEEQKYQEFTSQVLKFLDSSEQMRVAKSLGCMAGEKLYFLYRKNHLSQKELVLYLQRDSEGGLKSYLSLIEFMLKYPEPFLSKRLKI